MLTGKFPLPIKIPRQRSTKTLTHALEDFPLHEKSDITPTKLALDKVYAALPEQSVRSEEGKPKWGCYVSVSSTCTNGDPKRIFEEIYVCGGGDKCQEVAEQWIVAKFSAVDHFEET